jgi:predicted dinucleotide-binding enzyme
MDVTIIGTGNMARGIGTRLLAGGNSVTVLGKDEASAEAVADDIRSAAAGGATLSTGVSTGEPAVGEVVVLAVYYPDARGIVEHYGDGLSDKTVVDITNPVNETFDGLVTPADGSSPQELAKLAPGATFVKAFNTTFARTLVQGHVAGQPLDVFIAGDDEAAKATVGRLAEDGGLRAIDAGPLHRARELEALGLLHMTVQNALGTGYMSAVKVIA